MKAIVNNRVEIARGNLPEVYTPGVAAMERGQSGSAGPRIMNRAKPITVLLAEDHAMMRQALSALLERAGHFNVVGQAQNGREAVALAQTLRPDVIVMDLAMPVLNGLEAMRQILAANPAAKVIIISGHTENEYVDRTSMAGGVAFLEKQTSAEVLAKAICDVASGKTFFSPSTTQRRNHEMDGSRHRDGSLKVDGHKLTSRETEVLQLVAEGAANKQVAMELGISIKTVEKHRQNLMDKLNIHDTAGLTRYAISNGVIESNVRLRVVG